MIGKLDINVSGICGVPVARSRRAWFHNSDIVIFGKVVVRLIIDVTVMKLVTVAVAGRCLDGPRRTTATLPSTSAATTATTPTCSLRARGLALATFIRHVKTFPYGNRSHEGAECRRAQASLLRYIPP